MNYLKNNPIVLTMIFMGAQIAIIGKASNMSSGEIILFAVAFGLYTGSLVASAKKEAQK